MNDTIQELVINPNQVVDQDDDVIIPIEVNNEDTTDLTEVVKRVDKLTGDEYE